jgi:glucosamine-6-phosphate deaminase
MDINVFVTKDFEKMSEVAAQIAVKKIAAVLKSKQEAVLGLATGNSPTGMYKHLARAANEGKFDSGRIRSFNLDEYIGLPGDNAQERALHPESYAYFMVQELFGHLNKKFSETCVPCGSMIEQKKLIRSLGENKNDWSYAGTGAGRSIVIKAKAKSDYLAWIKKDILDRYARKIKASGGIDLQVIGVGGRGHVAFHEAGIPFRVAPMLLVKLDSDTIANAITDTHFKTKADSPRYAVSMSAGLVYQARTVMLVANGARKTRPVAESLLGEITPEVPISYGRLYARNGGELIYVLDRVAAEELLACRRELKSRGIILHETDKPSHSKPRRRLV